jgi:Putative prokaryotic signal transducing protein
MAEDQSAKTPMVQVAVAEDISEAEEIQAILDEVGIESRLESAVDHHPREVDDVPQKVLVPENSLEAAREAIEAMTEPENLESEA